MCSIQFIKSGPPSRTARQTSCKEPGTGSGGGQGQERAGNERRTENRALRETMMYVSKRLCTGSLFFDITMFSYTCVRQFETN